MAWLRRLGMPLARIRQVCALRPADAARAYKALAGSPGATEALRARALLGLARAYEAQDLILAAREALGRAQARYADLRLDDAPRGPATVGSLAQGP